MKIIKRTNRMIKLSKQSAAIALCMIAFFTLGPVPLEAAPKKLPVTINSAYSFATYPFPWTFTISGAFETSGTVTMEVDFNSNERVVHCVYTFVAPEGTIIIREQCTMPPDPWQGRWEIVTGTGAYGNLKGNGSALMPGNQENWVGFIYSGL